MVQALTQKEFDYQLEAERGQPDAAAFKLRRLTARERTALEDAQATATAGGDGGVAQIAMATGKANYLACRVGIAGWSGIPDLEFEAENGMTDPLACGKQRALVSDDALDCLPTEVITELGEAIMEGQFLTDDQAGN